MKLSPSIRHWRQVGLAVASITALGCATAGPVTYQFSGTVQSDQADRGYSTFTGSFNFDTATTDSIADTSTGAYAHGAGYGMSVTFDGTATLTLTDMLSMLITNNLGGADQLGVLAQAGQDSFSLSLWDFSQALLGSDALPVQDLSLADFDWSSLSWQSDAGELLGNLTSLACVAGCVGTPPPPPPPPPPDSVPEPSSLLLAALGLVALRAGRANAARTGGSLPS